MSVHVSSRVWRGRIGSPLAKLILLRLADNADETGENSYPSIATIARECEVSERTVQRALRELEAAGLLEIREPANRARHLPTRYVIKADASPLLSEPGDNLTPGDENLGVTHATPGRATSATPPGDTTDTRSVHDPSDNRSHDQDQDARAREKSSAEWYELVTERKPTSAMVHILEGIDFAHPPPCVKSTWESAASASEPWPYAKRIFDMCANGLQEHGPRAATNGRTNGRSQEGRNQGRGGSTDRRREEMARRRGGEW